MTDQQEPFDPDDFDRQLEALFAEQEAEPEPEEEDEVDPDLSDPEAEPDGGEVPEEDATSQGHPSPSPSSARLQELSDTDRDALIEFYDWVRDNPQQAVAIDAYLRGAAQFVPVEDGKPVATSEPAKEEEPEEDLEDLPESVRAKISEIDSLRERLDAVDAERRANYQSEVAAAITRAKTSVKERFGLSDEEVTELETIGEGLNVVQGLAQRTGDLTTAVETTLEMAYWGTEKFRDLAVAKYAEQQKKDTQRQTKASSLSSGSGSVPRGQRAPSTPDDRRSAMVSAVRDAMNESQE